MRRVLPLLLAAGAAPSPEPSPTHVTATCSNHTDCTAELQAALDSGARAVLVPYLGRPWPITPISLRSNQVVTLAPNVELVAKRGDETPTALVVEAIRLLGKTTVEWWGARIPRD